MTAPDIDSLPVEVRDVLRAALIWRFTPPSDGYGTGLAVEALHKALEPFDGQYHGHGAFATWPVPRFDIDGRTADDP